MKKVFTLIIMCFTVLVLSAQRQEWKMYKLGKVQAPVSGWDVAAMGISALGGYTMGLREAYHADSHVFERKFGAKPLGFFGSEAWKRKYKGNDPSNGKKSELFGNANRDFWHLSDKVQRGGVVLGVSLPLVQTKRPLKQRLILVGMNMLTYSFFYTRGYNIRYSK